MRSHLTDHPQIYVCTLDGTFSLDKHINSGKTPKAILMEEMKWLVREIIDRDKQLSAASEPMAFPSGAPHQRITHLNTSYHLLYTSVASDNLQAFCNYELPCCFINSYIQNHALLLVSLAE